MVMAGSSMSGSPTQLEEFKTRRVFALPVIPQEKRCISCGIVLHGHGATSFLCPECGKVEIGRCARCRDQSVLYKCPSCGFQGP